MRSTRLQHIAHEKPKSKLPVMAAAQPLLLLLLQSAWLSRING